MDSFLVPGQTRQKDYLRVFRQEAGSIVPVIARQKDRPCIFTRQKNRPRVFAAVVLAGMLLISGCGSVDNSGGGMVNSVIVHTTVTPGGEFPDYLDVSLKDVTRRKLDPSDFRMEGHATNWLDPSEHDFTASFSEVDNNGNSLRLWFDDFDDKYFFVTDWKVTYDLDSDLSFTSDQISEVITPVADDFTEHTISGSSGEEMEDSAGNVIRYWLYEPETAEEEPLPVVVVFHGYGDTNNIRAYRTSVAWAEPANQEIRPCYVLSPVIENSSYTDAVSRKDIYGAVAGELMQMAKDGKADLSRIYVMGNSFGGMASVEFAEEYPDLTAGGIILCGALNYAPDTYTRLDRILDIPLRLAAAEHDSTISSSVTKNLYDHLIKLGASDVSMKIYSDEEMNAAGADPDPDSTFSYHHVEMAVMEDPGYMEWLFSKSK